MSRTISGTYSAGITLTNTANNPVSVTGRISVASGYGLAAAAGSNNWTISNSGTITETGNDEAVFIGSFGGTVASGTLTNASGGVISSGGYGVFINGPASVTNKAGGTITGTNFKAIYITGGAGTIVNGGVLRAGNVAAYEYDGGLITNLAGGTITGAGGVWFQQPGTFKNSGVVIGTLAEFGSVLFNSSTGANRLVAYPGASFSGNITSLVGASNVVELGAGAGAGTLSGFGSGITNFTALQFDSGAHWTVTGNRSAAGLGTLGITGFTAHDTIDLTGFVASGYSYATGGLTLVNSASLHTTLHMSGGGLTTNAFIVTPDGSGGTDITVACFAAGTGIATPNGRIAVESLQPGDSVVSAFGGTVEVIWTGQRRIDCRRHRRPEDVWPVRVHPGAFGPGHPQRDLWLSPDHAVYVDNVLVPIRHLVNGATIVQEEVAEVTYVHLELPVHDVLLAEGLPAESYLDTGNRNAFANSEAVALHPDFARPHFAHQVWQNEACAQLVIDGEILACIRATLRARAEATGHRLTGEPAISLIVDGHEVSATREGGTHRFALPAAARVGHLRSRRFRPARLGGATADDRELGIGIAALELDGQNVPLDGPALQSGWMPPEDGLRWTGGDAAILLDGARDLRVTVGVVGEYWERAA